MFEEMWYFLPSTCFEKLREIVNFRYHVPRSWLKPSGNLLVVFEEWGGNPTGISLVRRSR